MKIKKLISLSIVFTTLFCSCYTTVPVSKPQHFKNDVICVKTSQEKTVLTFWGHLFGAALSITEAAASASNDADKDRNRNSLNSPAYNNLMPFSDFYYKQPAANGKPLVTTHTYFKKYLKDNNIDNYSIFYDNNDDGFMAVPLRLEKTLHPATVYDLIMHAHAFPQSVYADSLIRKFSPNLTLENIPLIINAFPFTTLRNTLNETYLKQAVSKSNLDMRAFIEIMRQYPAALGMNERDFKVSDNKLKKKIIQVVLLKKEIIGKENADALLKNYN